MIVYISIGNSDDKLTQAEWAEYIGLVDNILRRCPGVWVHVHGRWFAAPDVPWRSACWCVEIRDPQAAVVGADGRDTTLVADLRHRLTAAARRYRQDSIAWAHVPHTEFLIPGLEEK